MKKILLLLLLLINYGQNISAQTLLFSEDFNSGGSRFFKLNTTDLNCAGTSSNNQWIINNSYSGGSGNGTISCGILGQFTVAFNISNTPQEPPGINGYPNSYYPHIHDLLDSQINVFCSDFLVADSFCVAPDSNIVIMDTGINTIGIDNVALSFWWTCYGASNMFGKLCYSIDSGRTWIILPTKYNLSSSWKQEILSEPVFSNQPDLRFAFLWIWHTYQNGATILDPGFSFDDIKIYSNPAPEITTDSVKGNTFCSGTIAPVTFSTNGIFYTGNIFTVQLSDSAGSFANPYNCGRGASSPINASLPVSLSAGNSYHMRVVSSYPSVTGSPNGTGFTINPSPSINCHNVSGNNCDTTFQVFEVNEEGGTPPFKLSWVFSGPGIKNPNGNVLNISFPFDNDTAFYTSGGTDSYSVTVTDDNSCTTHCGSTFILQNCYTAGIQQPNGTKSVNIYPNPSDGEITVSTIANETIKEITITNVLGQTVSLMNISGGNNKTINVQLPQVSGLYFIHLRSATGEYVGKVVRE